MTSFLDLWIAFYLGTSLACLSHAVPGRFAGGRSRPGCGDPGFHRHPGAERAGGWRRTGAALGRCWLWQSRGGDARRWHGRFWIGRRPQRNILKRLAAVELPARLVARERSVLSIAGVRWAVFFARFVPPIRAFVPVTAGALGMPPAEVFTPSTSRRSCSGRPSTYCWGYWRYPRCTPMPAFRITPGKSASTTGS